MGSCICLPMIWLSTPLARTLMISFKHYNLFSTKSTHGVCQTLIAHELKSKAMLSPLRNFVGPLPSLRYGNSTIEYKVSCKCLGLTIDNRLSWQEHTKNVCDSFSKKVSVLKQIKLLPKPVFQKIYYPTILPSFLYGIVVWGSCCILRDFWQWYLYRSS